MNKNNFSRVIWVVLTLGKGVSCNLLFPLKNQHFYRIISDFWNPTLFIDDFWNLDYLPAFWNPRYLSTVFGTPLLTCDFGTPSTSQGFSKFF